MKLKNYIIFVALLSVTYAKAQVGIGTSSPNSSLDIRSSSQSAPSSTDGVLIPKIDIFPANPAAAQQGMLVYLTTAVGANQPGFYYWNFPTLTWIGLGASTPGWSLTGNAATTPGTNFLGTTDDKDIVLKRNNIRAGYIGDPVFAGASYNNANTVLGANSFINPTLSVVSQYGVRNTVIGANSMTNSTRGRRNVSVGESSMTLNTDGSENTVVGAGALYSNLTSSANVAIGRNTLTSATVGNNTGVGFASLRTDTTGGNNTALGYQSGYSNSTGSNNLYLGYNAGYQNTGSGNVMIGNETGYAETGNNKLYINNAQADAVNALVYGEFDNKKFRVNGEIQVGNQATTGYQLPVARGTTNQVLTTTNGATGATAWVAPSANLSVMRAQLYFPAPNSTVGDQALTGTDWQKILFYQSGFDTNNEFSGVPGNSRFTANTAGYYEVNAAYHIRALPTASPTVDFAIGIRVNGTVYYAENGYPNDANAIIARTVNSTVYLNANDYVEIYAKSFNTAAIIESFPGKTYFEVHQIK
jgi:hypothetical protein